ncbi:hypothetical protein K435DRAFT_256237 [Dendrothele bispora CBS 962.96]|uniref:Uncharacterized protein n=1 Tax=Dendrothele bispora (strain CBS 962.96) TaxID=1314807 RepID=A0A4S8LNU2_DENBC|nr:hypothetical protein K435DRAFT_256237 [Dendrothele bispora CBS 962.96]
MRDLFQQLNAVGVNDVRIQKQIKLCLLCINGSHRRARMLSVACVRISGSKHTGFCIYHNRYYIRVLGINKATYSEGLLRGLERNP